jgi:uncharacterized membrane protein
MQVDVTTEIEIARPRSEVAAYASNPDHVPDWYENISSIEWKTQPPLQVGSRVAFVAHFLGRRIAYTYEFVKHRPGEKLVMRTAEGPVPMETTYQWEDTPGGTRMTLPNRGTPSGFGRVAAPFMSRAIRRANRKDLLALKRRLEQRTSRPVQNGVHRGEESLVWTKPSRHSSPTSRNGPASRWPRSPKSSRPAD